MKHVRNIFRNTKTSSKNTDEKEKKKKKRYYKAFCVTRKRKKCSKTQIITIHCIDKTFVINKHVSFLISQYTNCCFLTHKSSIKVVHVRKRCNAVINFNNKSKNQ